MRYLLAVISLVCAANVTAEDVTVRRILDASDRALQVGENLRFWREVCVTETNVRVAVRRYIRVAEEPNAYVQIPDVVYGGFITPGCRAVLYEVDLPHLAPGSYIYEPAGLLPDGTVVLLPSEQFSVQ